MVFDFPIELERYIFELSATSSSSIASELALVARRVNQWIYPILYGTVQLYDNNRALRFLSSMKSKPSLASHVKSLYIHSEVYSWSAQSVLAHLRDIDSLFCLVSEPRLQKCLDAMHPSRLSMLFSGLAFTYTHAQPDFSHHSFSRVTHLHVFDHWTWWVTWTGIHLLPELTHIMLHYDDTIFASDDGQVAKFLRDILASCDERLQMCVLLHVHPLPSVFEEIQDWRLVTMPSRKDLAQDPDIWVAAEKRKVEQLLTRSR